MEGLKKAAIASFFISMLVLLGGGWLAIDRVPPYPGKIVSNGKELSGKTEIIKGQNAYQRYGLMDLGSVWGHGTLRGLDFSATTLNLTGRYMREYYAGKSGRAYSALDPDTAAQMRQEIIEQSRQSQTAILWTSHNMFEMERMCDRIIFLSHGEILAEGSPAALVKQFKQANLEETFIALARSQKV